MPVMRIFLDTSAFVKRYIAEPGREVVMDLCEHADSVGVSVICPSECMATLCRLRREGVLKMADYTRVKKEVLSDLEAMDVINLTPFVIGASITSVECFVLRGMDAIHIGCALDWHPDLFVSSDIRQLSAAEGMRLEVKRV